MSGEGKSPEPEVGVAELLEAIISVDGIKAEQGSNVTRAMNVDPDVLAGAAQERLKLATDALNAYEKEHGGPIDDEASISAFWIDGFLIGLYAGHRLKERA